MLNDSIGIALVLRHWDLFCVDIAPSSCIPQKSISSHGCPEKGGVAGRISETQGLDCSASPPLLKFAVPPFLALQKSAYLRNSSTRVVDRILSALRYTQSK
jgi:hypothetical protein